MGCLDFYLHGRYDERIVAKLREYSPILAGALFGAGWWFWVDAVVVAKNVDHDNFPAVYWIPGVAATLALICMNLVSREELNELSDSYSAEDGVATRARCWLFFSYLIAFGSVAGSASVLVTCAGSGEHVPVGVGALLQCGLILASGLLFWAFRTPSDDSYALIY